jgi:flagellar export protein FliJ
MKSLKILIKLHKKKLDDLTKQINNLENRKDKLNISLKKLQEQILSELKKFMGTEYVFMLDNYMKSSEDKEQKLKTQIKQLEEQILGLRDQLAEQFAELKKFEIALENRLKAEQEVIRKSEVKALDEFNTIKHNLSK